MNYHHLTIEERCCIREFYKNGKTFREIAVLVGRNVSTISREINRNKSFMNCKPAYYPHTAQKKYLLRRSFCHRGMFWNEEVIYYINDKLRNTWSPEQIANTSCGGRFTTGKSIRKRDKSVYKRKEFGHWEADTVVRTGQTKYCFATFAERTTRYYIAIKMPNRNGSSMEKAAIQALGSLPEGAVKSITCDRGSEFANWRQIEKALNCNMYFADP